MSIVRPPPPRGPLLAELTFLAGGALPPAVVATSPVADPGPRDIATGTPRWFQLSLAWPHMPDGECRIRGPDRRMGQSCPARSFARWSPRDDQILRRLYGLESASTIARRLGRTPKAVRRRGERLGLRQLRATSRGYLPSEVAEMLGVMAARVRRWLARGKLAGTRSELCWRIYPDDLEDFLRARRSDFDPRAIPDRAWAAFLAALPPIRTPRLWLTVAEAARLLPYGERGVRKLIARGDLAADLVDGAWCIPCAAVAMFMPPPLGRWRKLPEAVSRRREAELARRREVQQAAGRSGASSRPRARRCRSRCPSRA